MPRFINKRFIDSQDGFSPWRTPLDWLSRWGMNLIAYFAEGGAASAQCTANCDDHIGPVRCCFLACPHTECPYEGDKSNFQCPEPYHRTAWTCCDGSTLVGCGECACGNDCVSGPWHCSIAYEAGTC